MKKNFDLRWDLSSGRVYSALWTTILIHHFQLLGTGIDYPRNSCTDVLHREEGKYFYDVEIQLKQNVSNPL